MSAFHKFGIWVGRHVRRKTKSQSAPPSQLDLSTIPENRPLSPDERRLIEWLIEHGSPEPCNFASQVAEARVIGRCRCGCPTIDLGIGAIKERTVGASQILADFIGETPEGFRVGVLLHAREGKLSELEVYNLSDCAGAFSLPVIESLKPF